MKLWTNFRAVNHEEALDTKDYALGTKSPGVRFSAAGGSGRQIKELKPEH